MTDPSLDSKIAGALIGTAVGDSIGLPLEGLKPERIRRLNWAKHLKHRFFFGRGMWSDDTEQMILLAQSLLRSEGQVSRFTKLFAWDLKWWLVGLPAATGLATAKAILKLWIGFSPDRSGIFSAGNGPAMRVAPIAIYFRNDQEERRAFTEAQTKITHSDPKALIATLAISELIANLLFLGHPPRPDEIIAIIESVSPDQEWRQIVERIEVCFRNEKTIEDLLTSLGGNGKKGISGCIYQTVPCVILAAMQHHWGYQETITALCAAGGDTDTTAAIGGALCGALGGVDSIPKDWRTGLCEWPTTVNQLPRLAEGLKKKKPPKPIRARWSFALLGRNLFFLIIVLIHTLSRLLPAAILKSRSRQ